MSAFPFNPSANVEALLGGIRTGEGSVNTASEIASRRASTMSLAARLGHLNRIDDVREAHEQLLADTASAKAESNRKSASAMAQMLRSSLGGGDVPETPPPAPAQPPAPQEEMRGPGWTTGAAPGPMGNPVTALGALGAVGNGGANQPPANIAAPPPAPASVPLSRGLADDRDSQWFRALNDAEDSGDPKAVSALGAMMLKWDDRRKKEDRWRRLGSNVAAIADPDERLAAEMWMNAGKPEGIAREMNRQAGRMQAFQERQALQNQRLDQQQDQFNRTMDYRQGAQDDLNAHRGVMEAQGQAKLDRGPTSSPRNNVAVMAASEDVAQARNDLSNWYKQHPMAGLDPSSVTAQDRQELDQLEQAYHDAVSMKKQAIMRAAPSPAAPAAQPAPQNQPAPQPATPPQDGTEAEIDAIIRSGVTDPEAIKAELARRHGG